MSADDFTWYRYDEIDVDPRMKRALGDLEPLRKSISRYGMADPIIISRKQQLLSGWRRLNVMRSIGGGDHTLVPTKVVDTFVEAAELIRSEGASPEYTRPMTPFEMYRRADFWEEFYQPETDERMRQKAIRASETRKLGRQAKPRETHDHHPLARPQLFGKLLGHSRWAYDAHRHLYRALKLGSEQERDLASHLWSQLDAGHITINFAAQQLKAGKLLPMTNRMIPVRGRGRTSGRSELPVAGASEGPVSAEMQRRILESTTATQRGLIQAYRQLGQQIHPDLTPDEARQWERDLIRARRVMTQTINMLRRHN